MNSISGVLSFKISLDEREPESPIVKSVEALKLVKCRDCARCSKVQPALAMTMYVYPYCGIGQFNGRELTSFRVLLYKHANEASALLRADYDGLETAIVRYLSFIDKEPHIQVFIRDCVQEHLPRGI